MMPECYARLGDYDRQSEKADFLTEKAFGVWGSPSLVGQRRIQQMAARFLDDHVVAQVLSALAPAALELSVTAAGQAGARRAEVDRIWRQRTGTRGIRLRPGPAPVPAG